MPADSTPLEEAADRVSDGTPVEDWPADAGVPAGELALIDQLRAIYVHARGQVPARVFRIDLASGRRTLVRELTPADPTGISEILRIVMTADASTYAYSYTRELSDLFLVSGLK